MGRIYLVRHGQTRWNLEKRLQGRRNPGLTQQGKEQAKKIAEYFKNCEKIDFIYSSSLNRAIQTAKIISKRLSLMEPIRLQTELSEMSFGELEGKLESEVISEIEKYLNNKANYRFPGGEDYNSVLVRVKPIIRRILLLADKFNILIIGHQAVNRAIIGAFFDLPKENFVEIDHPHDGIYIFETEAKTLFFADINKKKKKKLKF